MPETMAKRIEILRALPLAELRKRYREAFDGKEAPTINPDYLWRKIAWRIQERELGGLSPEALARIEELKSSLDRDPAPSQDAAQGSAVPPSQDDRKDRRLPAPGTFLRRMYKDRTIEVKVLAEGFEYEGRPFKSLSAVAKQVTGANWSGYLFFNL